MGKFNRGPGFWRFNVSLLGNIDYVNDINVLIEKVLKTTFENVLKKWDYLKMEIRGLTIKFSARKKKSQNNYLQIWERRAEKLKKDIEVQLVQGYPVEREQLAYEEAKEEIEVIIEKRVMGSKIRSRTNWFLYGEKPSSYFAKLEKFNYNRKNRYVIKKENGTLVHNPSEILKIQHEYYRKLYTKVELPEDNLGYLDKLQAPKLSVEDKDRLDQPIQPEEIVQAMKDFDNNKAPGPDGFPIEFYRFFFSKFKALLMQVVVYMSQFGLSLDQGEV